jgi:hypothetical protein
MLLSMSMERLDQTSVRALRVLLDTQPMTDAKIEFAWKIAAGSALARATTITWSANGTLHVLARSEEWRREIVRAQSIIGDRFSQLLGAGVVTRITVAASTDDGPRRDRRLAG